jgi:dihydrofolate synthase/folylpolyglutamate synthase
LTSPDFSLVLESLFKLQRFGIKLGLEHTFQLLDRIGNPHHNLILIHVAGTNGKGSTSAIITKILRESGKKVGLYTSPHLVRFNERIRVDGIPITDEEIIFFMKKAEQAILKIKSTFFETTTAMALDHFNSHKVDIAVIETGLGGRLDSTNVITPALTVITPISMDHMEILGKDIETISSEKAGIIKNGVPLICGKQNSIAEKIIDLKSKESGAVQINVGQVIHKSISLKGSKFSYKGKQYQTAFMGEHQAENSALAIECIHNIYPDISYDTIQNGLMKAYWPGRIQPIGDRLYYDVAHNEDGIKSLLKTIKQANEGYPLFGLFCIKGDKDLHRLLNGLSGQFKKLLVTSDKEGLLLDASLLSNKLSKFGVENEVVSSISIGITKLNQFVENGGVGIIFGSHYIAKEVYSCVGNSFDNDVI